MKIKLVAILTILVLVGCKSQSHLIQVPVKTVERRVTTLVPFQIHGDSATLQAYFECDSLNNVLMKEINEGKSKNISTEHSFKNGSLNYKAKTQPDTMWLTSDTIYTEKQVPFEVEVPVVEVKMSGFQRLFFIIGLVATGIILAFIVLKINKLNILKL